MQRHYFHLVTRSPWPFCASIAALFVPVNAVLYFHSYKFALVLLMFSVCLLLLIMALWWRDVIREATYNGDHTKIVQKGLRYGMILFIVSEIMFFFAFFWAFGYCAWLPNQEIGLMWPPLGITVPTPWGIPLVNTALLLWSGVALTLSHYTIKIDKNTSSIEALGNTIWLAIFFTFLQYFEYVHSTFTLADGVYGSTFYMTTGFHGLHVIIGTIFLSVAGYRLVNGEFTPKHHLGFEFGSWYWHFVDVVWLFLFFVFYIWGSYIVRII